MEVLTSRSLNEAMEICDRYNEVAVGIVLENMHNVTEFIELFFREMGNDPFRRQNVLKVYEMPELAVSEELDSFLSSFKIEENSNKNAVVVSTQRDYMAGEVSKDLTMRLLLPPDIVEAHNDGLIHFHDSDYFVKHMHNCELVNLDDMLQNGTVINGTRIDKPKSFMTACTVATQIVAQIASVQYGGQTISVSHLAPFVRISYEKLKEKTNDYFKFMRLTLDAAIRIINNI